jgi:hypothetical protein
VWCHRYGRKARANNASCRAPVGAAAPMQSMRGPRRSGPRRAPSRAGRCCADGHRALRRVDEPNGDQVFEGGGDMPASLEVRWQLHDLPASWERRRIRAFPLRHLDRGTGVFRRKACVDNAREMDVGIGREPSNARRCIFAERLSIRVRSSTHENPGGSPALRSYACRLCGGHSDGKHAGRRVTHRDRVVLSVCRPSRSLTRRRAHPPGRAGSRRAEEDGRSARRP